MGCGASNRLRIGQELVQVHGVCEVTGEPAGPPNAQTLLNSIDEVDGDLLRELHVEEAPMGGGMEDIGLRPYIALARGHA